MEGVADIMPRIISGLKASGVLPGLESETAHIAQIRKALGEPLLTQEHESPKHTELVEEQESPTVSVDRFAKAEKVVTNDPFLFWIGVVILSSDLGWIVMTAPRAFFSLQHPDLDWFRGVLTIFVVLIIPGILCLGRGMARELRAKPTEGGISN